MQSKLMKEHGSLNLIGGSHHNFRPTTAKESFADTHCLYIPVAKVQSVVHSG